MNDSDSYLVEFRLADSGDASPAEFRYLFAAIDHLTRALTVEQMRLFVEGADLSDRGRDEIFASLIREARHLAPPVQVVSVRRESPWSVIVGLSVAAMLWAMRKMIAPEILQAWGESQLKENFKRFVRDGLFQGAKEQLEASAAAKPQYGNLLIDDVAESAGTRPDQPTVTISLKRTEVLQIEIMTKFPKEKIQAPLICNSLR
jgi:hypothetical protein